MRLYLVIHSDHEGGNVSAHTCHLVGRFERAFRRGRERRGGEREVDASHGVGEFDV